MQLAMDLIFAKDMDRMTAFYRDAIGLDLLPGESSQGWAVFNAGGGRLALHAIPIAIAQDIEIQAPPKARGNTP